MEILKHHIDACRPLAKREGTPEEVAFEHVESMRAAGHIVIPHVAFDEDPTSDYLLYALDNPENFQKMLAAVALVVDSIRKGAVEEVPDEGSYKDIICLSCKHPFCSKKKTRLYL